MRVGLISLGCAKNLVDAEVMLGTLLKDGVEITNDTAQADVVIVNTCSFIDSAQEESVDTILESAELREAKNRGQGLIVSGCLPQRFRDELPTLLPEVDAFMGIDQVAQVTDIVKQALARRAQSPEREVRSPKSEVQSRKSEVRNPRAPAVQGSRSGSAPPSSTSLTPPSPVWLSTRAPATSPTTPRRASGSRRGTSPTSRSPKAATIRAASASFPACAARIAAGRRRTSSPKPRR